MNETYEKDGIYELYTGDFIDLSNLVTISSTIFDRWHITGDENWIQGYVYFECKFRFLKDSAKFFEGKLINGYKEDKEKELEERTETFEVERQKLIKAWKKYKEANK